MKKKTLRFPDGTIIKTKGNVTVFLFQNHPDYLEQWLEHKAHFDAQMELIEAFLKKGREGGKQNY